MLKGSTPFSDWTTVAVCEVKVYLTPQNTYIAVLSMPGGKSLRGKEAPFPNKAMTHLMDLIYQQPLFDGQQF